MRLRNAVIMASLMMVALTVSAEIKHLLPTPHSVTVGGDAFALNREVRIVNVSFDDVELLYEVLEQMGCTVSDEADATIKLNKVSNVAGADESIVAGFDSEAYRLVVDGNNITIEATSRVGVIRALQTLQQLAEVDSADASSAGNQQVSALEGVAIVDWPSFKVRGFMHDVGRSFITVDELEKQIKLYSRFKINVFQWHMTENQAWRFEVKNTENNTTDFDFSKLTASSNMTRFAGKFYSREDCRRLDSVAHRYGVYIIPELDMPGHSEAFTRATGVNMQSDKGVDILTEALNQCCEVFSHSPYIHIGGDEVAITYPNFLNRMSDVVRAHDKKVVWWNTCAGVGTTHKLVDPSTDHCDMAQCWATSGRKVNGIPCIDCRYNYTNHFDVFADLVGMYRSTILGDQNGKNGTAGFISCPWNDRKTPTQEDIIKQNNVYAVTIASGERAWKGGGKQYIEQGGAVLPNSGDEYDEFCDWERRFLFHKAHSLRNEPIPYVRQTNVRWLVSSPIQNGGNGAKVFGEWENCKDTETAMPNVVSLDGQTYGWTLATGAGIYLNHTWGSATVPGIWGKVTQSKNQTAYAYTYIYNPGDEQVVGAQIEFQNYGRSEKDPAPSNGNWDRKGSKIWWNGSPIAPPTWGNNGGGGGNNETPLLNENFPARQPIPLTLRSGWNKVFIKLPYVNDGCRLSKWMFTFVLTDLDGRNAVGGLIYSPYKTVDGKEPKNYYTITDEAGNQYTGSYTGGEGIEPQFDGVEGYLLTDKQWTRQDGDVLFTATITFPFAVSSEDCHRYNNISAFSGSLFNWYANANGYLYATKGATGTADQYQWMIFPELTGNSFTFRICNKKYNKYIYTTSTANTHNEGTVRLSNNATPLQYRTNGFATTLSPSKFISVNSSSPTTAQCVGTWDAHLGTRLLITCVGEEQTSIQAAMPTASSALCYDLSGRRTTSSNALYIKNRKKFLKAHIF